jgi:cell division protease FtsH
MGHALLALLNNKYFDVFKVSIKSTYNGAGGYTLFSEKPEFKDGGLYTKDLLYNRLVIAMGGKAAESVFFGDDFISVGASQDLKQANSLAREMIGMYGMGDELKVFHNENQNGIDLYSDNTKSKIDNESLQLVNYAYEEAKHLVEQEKEYVEHMINSLLDKKVLFFDDLQSNQLIINEN